MTLDVHPAASDEVSEAAAFFDARDETLADAFFTAWRTAKAAILADPERYPLAEDSPPRHRVQYYWNRRFKYRVLYWVHDDTVTILAVAWARRRPGYWHARMSETNR